MNKPLEKTKGSSSTPAFSLLPDDITVTYLARIPRPYYPRLSTVSKSFRSLLSSTELYKARYNLGNTEHCLYLSIWEANRSPQWFTLWINPNQTLTNKKKTLGNLLVPVPLTDILNSTEVVVGSEIYFIGREIDGRPSSVVRILNCRTHTLRDAPSMNVAREFPDSCFHDGKIYVLGGCREEDAPWAEVFDLKTHTWEPLPEPGTVIRECIIYRIDEMKGKINFDNNRGSETTMYAYDTKQGKWEHCGNASEMFQWSDCVIENVSYSCTYKFDCNSRYGGPSRIWWYDIKVETWKRVQGLESFREKHSRFPLPIGIGSSILVSCGGKLLLVWEVSTSRNDKKIWCAVIKVEKRHGGEIWAKVDWYDVVLTMPKSRSLVSCLSVSV